jgi:hypothetical protein
MSMSTRLRIRYSVAGEQEHEEGEEETGKTSNVEASFALSVIEGIEPRKRVRLTRLNFLKMGKANFIAACEIVIEFVF